MKALHNVLGIFYLILGIIAIGCSYYIQASMLSELLGTMLLAHLIVAPYEGVKIGMIINSRLERHSREKSRRPDSFRVHTLRTSLIAISAVFTVLWLATSTHLPNAEALRAADLSREQSAYTERVDLINRSADSRAQGVRQMFAERRAKIEARHDKETAHLSGLMDDETDNVVNGKVVGVRYKSYMLREDRADQKYRDASAELMREKDQTMKTIAAIESERRSDLMAAEAAHQKSIKAIHKNTYADDPRAEHQLLFNFRSLLETVFQTKLSNEPIVFLFSVFMGVILELIIFELFSRFGDYIGPYIAAYRRYQNSLLDISAKTAVDVARDAADIKKTKSRFTHSAEKIYEDLDDCVSSITKFKSTKD